MAMDPGSTIGDYKILEPLGTGGMGQVFKVQNLISNRTEAMKVLLPDLSGQADQLQRFLREIQVQASLIHPNIAALYSASRIDNRLLMFMEFVNGETLAACLARGPLPPAQALTYGLQVLGALAFAHERGVVHRDIKPSNIMLTVDGTAKLLDFGLAAGTTDKRLTRTGQVVGSLYYMSPEQVRGDAPGYASDIYAMGLTLYEMLTGRRGIQGNSDFELMSAQLQSMPEPPAQVNPYIPEALSQIVLKAVAKRPEARFATVAEFIAALENYRQRSSSGSSTLAYRPGMEPSRAPTPATVPYPTRSDPSWMQAGMQAAPTLTAQAAAQGAFAQATSSQAAAPQMAPSASYPGVSPVMMAPPTGSSATMAPPNRTPILALGGAVVAALALAAGGFAIYRQLGPRTAVTSVATPPPATTTAPASPGSTTAFQTPPATTPGTTTPGTTPRPFLEPPKAADSKPGGPKAATQQQPPPAVVASKETAPKTVAKSEPVVATPPPTKAPAVPVKTPQQIQAEEWARIRDSSDPEEIRAFLAKYPIGPLSVEANSRLADIEWQILKPGEGSAVYRAFAARFPDSVHAAEALATASRLDRRHEILEVLKRFQEAFDARDLRAIKEVWPSASSQASNRIAELFKKSRSVTLKLEPLGGLGGGPKQAEISCKESLMFLEGSKPRQVDGTLMVHFVHAPSGWLIDSVTSTGTPSLYQPF